MTRRQWREAARAFIASFNTQARRCRRAADLSDLAALWARNAARGAAERAAVARILREETRWT